MKFVKVIIDNASDQTDIFYTYRCRYDEVKRGSVLRVPFGKGNRSKKAWVFEILNETPDNEELKKVKDVEEIYDSYVLPEDMLDLCIWMHDQYLCRYIDAVKCVIPQGDASKRGKRKDPYIDMEIERDHLPLLTSEQEYAVEQISEIQISGRYGTVLLNGVTNSGKTEVYLRAVSKTIEMGKQAIVLVPEISLTPQTISRFMARFGNENVAVLHSKMTRGARYDQWMRVRNGGAKILIGARSGIFAPFENLGMIIIDEEHESSYKSDKTPKYDAVDTAIRRAVYKDAVVILGSATPSVVSKYRAESGKYKEICMKQRYNKVPLPSVETVDMREELRRGNRSIFSVPLVNRSKQVLEEGGQIIFFLNRRGYSSFISCRSCGYVLNCDSCGISMTYHKSGNTAECHYCGRKVGIPEICPSCGSKYIKYFGIGTEQVEEFTRKIFPNYEVGRLDLDTASRKGEAERIINSFKKGKTKILVGTQLVAKGLDFSNVSLVGIIAADITLNIPDYRSSERTFQLIVQAAGRSGRGDRTGHVIIQTYSPDERAVTAAAQGNFEGFYRDEIMIRKLSGYPPFTNIIRLIFYSEDEGFAVMEAQRVCDIILRSDIAAAKDVFQPQPAYMKKMNGSYRYHILIKSPKEKTNDYLRLIAEIKDMRVRAREKNTTMIVEIDPYSLT